MKQKLQLENLVFDKSTSKNSETTSEESRSEPIFESQIDHDQSTIPDSLENEGESEKISNDDEFNQETEEELLDIPTFLRRQAN